MKNYEELLRRMGKGWFVLKLAETRGVSIDTKTNYGKGSSMDTRLSCFESCKAHHRSMLDYLLSNWSSKITAGSPVVSNKDLHDIACKICF